MVGVIFRLPVGVRTSSVELSGEDEGVDADAEADDEAADDESVRSLPESGECLESSSLADVAVVVLVAVVALVAVEAEVVVDDFRREGETGFDERTWEMALSFATGALDDAPFVAVVGRLGEGKGVKSAEGRDKGNTERYCCCDAAAGVDVGVALGEDLVAESGTADPRRDDGGEPITLFSSAARRSSSSARPLHRSLFTSHCWDQ